MTNIIQQLATTWQQQFKDMAVGTLHYHFMPDPPSDRGISHQATGMKPIGPIASSHRVAQHFQWCHAISQPMIKPTSQWKPIMLMCLEHTLQGLHEWIHPLSSRLQHDHYQYQIGMCIQQFNAITHTSKQALNHTELGILFSDTKRLLSQLSSLQGARGLMEGDIRDLYWLWTHLTSLMRQDTP